MSKLETKVEILYPEYGNQGGDNGNYMYVEACLSPIFAGNAADLLGKEIVNPDGSRIAGLGLFDYTTTRYMPRRFHDVQVGTFEPGNGEKPFEVVGFKMQFTLTEGDNSSSYFIRNSTGFGINKESKLEGFRRGNCIATWIIGPLLPLNPYLMRWFLDTMGEKETPLAFEQEAVAAYEKHLREMVYPGMHLHY